ncbi:MAG: OB-fold nucleic acid binding domain-containing protein, partial [Candidatus Paceibacterota bacterium]
VGSNIVSAIIEERQRGGPFLSIEDVLSRVLHKDLNKKSLESLIKAGVFDSLNIERNQMLKNIDKVIVFSQGIRKHSGLLQNNLFGSMSKQARLVLEKMPEATKEEKLFWEKELMGFYVSDHPLKKYQNVFEKKKAYPIRKIIDYINSGHGTRSVRLGGIITNIKRIISKNNRPIAFAKIEDINDTLEVIVFSDILEKNPQIWQENNIVIIQGKPSLRDNEPKIIVEEAVKLN